MLGDISIDEEKSSLESMNGLKASVILTFNSYSLYFYALFICLSSYYLVPDYSYSDYFLALLSSSFFLDKDEVIYLLLRVLFFLSSGEANYSNNLSL